MPAPPDVDTLLARFENMFQLWLHGEIDTRALNEEIERVYRGMKKPAPERCRHGFTRLTCAECYVNGFKNERGDAV